MLTYYGSYLTLTEDTLIDNIGVVSAEKLLERQPKKQLATKELTPIVKKMVNIALHDIEENMVVAPDGTKFFGAGRQFTTAVFTRDVALSSLLALNELHPALAIQSLEYTRKVRRNTGFKAPHEEYTVRDIVPRHEEDKWEVVDLPEDELAKMFPAGALSRRTDDVVWIWAYFDLLQRTDAPVEKYEWLYEEALYFFDRFYECFLDERYGLYRGQSPFIDVHFPEMKANGYPLNWTIGDCCHIITTALNSMYKIAMDCLSKTAKLLGKDEEAKEWDERAELLRCRMIQHLEQEDGTLAYYIDRLGNRPYRREALGTALAVFAGIQSEEKACKSMESYPMTDHGMPLMHPFLDHSEQLKTHHTYTGHRILEKETHYAGVYHNDTSWAFVDAFFCMAYEQATGKDIKDYALAVLARNCRNDNESTFTEVTNFNTQKPFGSHAQLWSACGFINVLLRGNYIK